MIFRLFNFPSSLADGAVASLLKDEAYINQYVSTYQTRLAESYARAAQFCRANGIDFRQSNAALFLMVNLANFAQDKSLSDDDILAMLRRKKVYVTSASGYRSEKPGWFRVVIAHPQHVLDEGLNRILQALSPGKGQQPPSSVEDMKDSMKELKVAEWSPSYASSS